MTVCISYFHMSRCITKAHKHYLPGKQRATVHDVLDSYRPVIKNAKLYLNAGITPEEGASLIESGKVDGVFIGFNWIMHPDLVKRIRYEKALDNVPNIPALQWKGSSELGLGYTDYPIAVY